MNVHPTTHHESLLRAQGHSVIAGVDEAGRGPLAGPVVAAAVILPDDFYITPPVWAEAIHDSKLLSPGVRESLYDVLLIEAIIGVGVEEAETIDRINILRATHSAMHKAVRNLRPRPHHVLVDGNPIGESNFPYTAIVKGDRKSFSIAAASIIAKVTRDRRMLELDGQYPMYGFANHKGYATREHLEQLRRHGPCPEHRRSFEPVRLAAEIMEASAIGKSANQLCLSIES